MSPISIKSWIIIGGISLGVIVILAILLPIMLLSQSDDTMGAYEIALKVLKSVPLIDGHNDLPNNLNEVIKNQLSQVNLRKNLTLDPVWGKSSCENCYTDIPRLREGRVGAVFWVAYVKCITQYKDAVEQTLQQIDVIKRMINQYSDEMQYVTTAQGIESAFAAGKIGSLIAVEGGHSIDGRLAVLRLYYELGTRYMTLTHTCSTRWADASPVDQPSANLVRKGLTVFGKTVVKEMNRLGMMVDLSHVSKQTQLDVIEVTRAPVIFSHSGAFNICNHHRNVHDDVLTKVTRNNGIVMVNFYSHHIACGMNATIHDVVAHINHIRMVAGVNHVGIGGDYDGVEIMPEGLEDVSKYPDLFALLAGDKNESWTEEELRKLAGLNLIRVFKQVEMVRDQMFFEDKMPFEDLIPNSDIDNDTTSCMTS